MMSTQSDNFVPHIRTALFVDFDNIFIRLQEQDACVANRFATNPEKWLAWAETQKPYDALGRCANGRKILVRKCYLNPQTFQKYRPYFIRSAFEVVDCPPLTNQGKTSADIHIVMDILDSLSHATHFDEFMIFSGDADFTPLLLRLRQYDRRSAVLSVGYTSPAYKAACDYVIEEDAFIETALGVNGFREYTDEPCHIIRICPEKKEIPAEIPLDPNLKTDIAKHITDVTKESNAPIALSKLAQQVGRTFGEKVWLDSGMSFKDFLMGLGISNLKISAVGPGYIYDPSRHDQPRSSDQADAFMSEYPEIAPIARKIHQLTDVPYLPPHHYEVLLRAITEEVNKNGFQLNRTSKMVRDRCNEMGASIARAHVNFVLRAITFIGHRLGENEFEKPEELGEALIKDILKLCKIAQLEPTKEEVWLIHDWIKTKNSSTLSASPR